MAKSIFTIAIHSKPEVLSIKSIAEQLIDLFCALGNVDDVFLSPVYCPNERKKYQLTLSPSTKQQSIDELSLLILKSSEGDILKHEKEKYPTIDYKRDFGFMFLFDFKKNGVQLFSVTAILGSVDGHGVSIKYFNKDNQYDYGWYENVLKTLVECIDPLSGYVYISNTTFTELYTSLKVNYVLGWITYFSKKLPIDIPDNLDGIEYEYTEKGKYLIFSKDDITLNKEIYNMEKDRLTNIIKYLKNHVSGYSNE